MGTSEVEPSWRGAIPDLKARLLQAISYVYEYYGNIRACGLTCFYGKLM